MSIVPAKSLIKNLVNKIEDNEQLIQKNTSSLWS